MDETAFQAASATRATSFVTGIVDLTPQRGSGAAARRGRRPLRIRAGQLAARARPRLAGFAAVDDVRRRIQRETTGHRGRVGDPLYGILRLLAGLDAGDTDDEQLARTWIAAQDLRLIYHAGDRARAAQALYRWLASCADADIPELTRLARTLDPWRDELLAYFDTGGVSNGPTEAINLLIKKIKRVGHGFRNFLMHCGVDWDTVRASPIRSRLPRSVT